MLFRRLHIANKKAQKRWDFYHARLFDFYGGYKPASVQLPPLGAYRKNKGCGFCDCSSRKRKAKDQLHETLRTQVKALKALLR